MAPASPKPKILLVEDDAEMAILVADHLTASGFEVESVQDGKEGLHRMMTNEYDAIILDWELPHLQGTTACMKFREKDEKTPVIMLTGRAYITDKEQGFQSGADDYLTKPFEMRELMLRLRSLMKRASFQEIDSIKFGDVEIDLRTRTVRKAGIDVHLFRTDFELLQFLIKSPGKVFSGEALLDFVYPCDSNYSTDAIRASIKRIRAKLDTEGQESCIKTVHRVGYKFEA